MGTQMKEFLRVAQSLLERLETGFTCPDDELYALAYSYKACALQYPAAALAWLPRFRARGPVTEHLYEAIKDIVEPGMLTPLNMPAPIVIPKHAAVKPLPPVCNAPAKTDDAAFLQAECLVISQKYFDWRKQILTDTILQEIERFAPNRVQEVMDLESRSDDAQNSAVRLAILRKAGSIWASLLNIKEPAYD